MWWRQEVDYDWIRSAGIATGQSIANSQSCIIYQWLEELHNVQHIFTPLYSYSLVDCWRHIHRNLLIWKSNLLAAIDRSSKTKCQKNLLYSLDTFFVLACTLHTTVDKAPGTRHTAQLGCRNTRYRIRRHASISLWRRDSQRTHFRSKPCNFCPKSTCNV